METDKTAGAGKLGRGEFAALLRSLMRQLATGRLELNSGGERRQLWLESGGVRAVVSDGEEEKIGKFLVTRGLLDPGRMALALLRQPDGVRFGTFLVQEGLLDNEQLSRALEMLAVEIVARVLMPPSEYAFHAGERLPDDATSVDMTSADLLTASVRRYDNVAELESLLSPESYPCGVEDALLGFQRVSLSPQEAFLLSRVDGSMTVSQLRRVVPLPREEVVRGLAALVMAGVVELRPTPGSRPVVAEPVQLPARAAPEVDPMLEFTPEQRREYQEVVRLAAECTARDHYRRLGLTQGATLNQVHERYREFVRVYHPDRAREPHLRAVRRELAEINTALQEAYETLVHPEKRARYTDMLKSNVQQPAHEQAQDERRLRARRELAHANVQRAQALVRAGDFGAAVLLLDEAVRAEPNPESLLLLARLEQRNPMWTTRVLDHLRMAVTIDPQYTEAWLELASFWGKRAQKERQRQCFEKILAYDPRNGEVLRLLAALKTKK